MWSVLRQALDSTIYQSTREHRCVRVCFHVKTYMRTTTCVDYVAPSQVTMCYLTRRCNLSEENCFQHNSAVTVCMVASIEFKARFGNLGNLLFYSHWSQAVCFHEDLKGRGWEFFRWMLTSPILTTPVLNLKYLLSREHWWSETCLLLLHYSNVISSLTRINDIRRRDWRDYNHLLNISEKGD